MPIFHLLCFNIQIIMTEVLKSDLRKLSIDQLTDVMMRMGEPAFRSRQIYEWLWQKSATDIAEMTNLPLTLRKKRIKFRKA